jgi:hypothetical protein
MGGIDAVSATGGFNVNGMPFRAIEGAIFIAS